MIVETFFDEGLGNSSYLVAPANRATAVVIDPQRDVDRYLEAAARRGWRITDALETHLHADFVSGSRELAARVGARISASAGARLAFPHRGVRDQEVFEAGGLQFRALATPGHTPEHVCFLVLSGSGTPAALFSGGTLLVGSAARTDLIAPEWTERLTRDLYRSLQEQVLTLPDDLPVLPTHGAGSFCATGTRQKASTTIGEERLNNPLLAAPSEDAFVTRALRDLPAYPDYFRRMRGVNQAGPAVLGGVPHPPPLSPQTVRTALAGGATLIDLRPPEAFDAGHIPGAFGIPLTAAFGSWAGWVVPPDANIILVADRDDAIEDAVRQLIRVGYDRFAGYLAGGLDAWQAAYPIASIPRIPGRADSRAVAERQVVDVREASEWQQGHIPGALSLPLSDLREHLDRLPRDRPLLVHCAHEFRSTIADSLLERAGFRVAHLVGGFEAWHEAGQPVHVPAATTPVA